MTVQTSHVVPTSAVIAADRVWTGTADAALVDAFVHIADGAISTVGERRSMPAHLRSLPQFDYPGCTILPGLIDMHSHVSFDMTSPRTPYAELADPEGMVAVRAVGYLQEKLRSGVTTVRAMSEQTYVAVALRESIRQGLFVGPKLIVAGIGLKALHGWGHTAVVCAGEDEIRTAIRRNLQQGCDLTKLFLTNNGTRVGTGHGVIPAYFSDSEITTAIDESHRNGIPVAGHCLGGEALQRFVRAGGDTVEHGIFMTDEDIEVLADSPAWLVGTLGYLFDRQDISAEPDSLRAREVVCERYMKAVSAGVKFVSGTDDGREGMTHEIECLVRAGLSINQALRAATADAAACLGLQDRGTITAGKRADCFVVRGDPFERVNNLAEIEAVFLDGDPVQSAPTAGFA